MINIAIGYPSHISTYAVSQDTVDHILVTHNADAINTIIVNEGTFVGGDGADSDAFFDLANDRVAEFLQDLKDVR